MSNSKSKSNYKTNSRANSLAEKDAGLFQIGIVTLFTAVVMMIVRLTPYKANLNQFFWSKGGTSFVDFFSLAKSQIIFILVVLALLVLLFRVFTQSFILKKSPVYIPMLVYVAFVVISYFFSAYKEFALFGWNDRFEGTLILISYMIMLFYVINTVNAERHVKWIITPLAYTSTLLGILGISQYYIADFFKTDLGKKLITPSSFWAQIDKLNFNFENGQIYQTVFNPNYVSFYLTLLVPLFAMLFIREKRIVVKCGFGFIYGLSLFNLIGSASSNGILGLAMSFIIAVIVLNKRLIEWRNPIFFIFLITLLVGALTFSRFLPELSRSFKATTGQDRVSQAAKNVEASDPTSLDANPLSYKLDYFETGKDFLNVGVGGDQFTVTTQVKDNKAALSFEDQSGKALAYSTQKSDGLIHIDDARFSNLGISMQLNKGVSFIVIHTGKTQWPFTMKENGFVFVNGIGKPVALNKVPHWGFEGRESFGTYRGYIWSRSLPMLKDTLLIGKGADTFCLYFPQNDYTGRYSANWSLNIVVDKVHNFYLATALNTGMISLLALLSLFGIYLWQSFPLYKRASYAQDYLTFCGAGIFIGISGFLVSAIFNDSSVSVMPLFYGLLGTGFAINRMLSKRAVAHR